MIFSIDRDIFLENLNVISRGLPVKSSNPILTGIKIEVTKDNIFMTSSNNDISIELMINDSSLVVEEIGKTIIPGKFFIDIIRKINSKKIKLSLIDNKYILLNVDRGEYKLNIMDYNDYPNIEFVNLDNPLTIDVSLLKSIIKETNFATSTSERRPILTGVNLSYNGDILTVLATDSYRLAKKEIKLAQDYKSFNLTIPSKSLDELLKIVDSYEGNLNIYFDNNKILIKFNNILFQTRILEGEYPDTSRAINTNFNMKVEFNKDEFIESLERVSLLSPRDKEKDKEITYSIITLNINDSKVEISTDNFQVGNAKEELIANILESSGPINISFSSKYLLEALRAFDGSKVILNLISDIRPFIITSEFNKTLIQLVLPVRPNN